jgi:hypothetical protein
VTFNDIPVPTALESLLATVDEEITRRPSDLPALRSALLRLFAFLASPDGGTDGNVCVVDSFLSCGLDDESYWSHLPESYRAVLWDAGGQLHDTFSSPSVAANFESTPEQLLARAEALDVNG